MSRVLTKYENSILAVKVSREVRGRGTVPEFESVWSDLQGVAFSQGYLDAGGVRTRYLHAGDPGNPALVLLHGSGGHAEAYVRNLEAHAEHFSTWSIDMLGHGYTDKPGHPLEIAHYVEHLVGVPVRDRRRARPHQR